MPSSSSSVMHSMSAQPLNALQQQPWICFDHLSHSLSSVPRTNETIYINANTSSTSEGRNQLCNGVAKEKLLMDCNYLTANESVDRRQLNWGRRCVAMVALIEILTPLRTHSLDFIIIISSARSIFRFDTSTGESIAQVKRHPNYNLMEMREREKRAETMADALSAS